MSAATSSSRGSSGQGSGCGPTPTSGGFSDGVVGAPSADDAARSLAALSSDKPAASLTGGAEGYLHATDYGTVPAGLGMGLYGSVNISYDGFSGVADLLAANDGKYGAALADAAR